MKEKYAVVMTTCSNLKEAQVIIDALLADRLAACIQTMPINSHYYWNDEINRDSEILLYIKTKMELFEKIKSTILKNHSYDVPEIILLPIKNGHFPYLNWIDETTCQ
ncbi:MAG: divalent-cation tolerance protein CutA [Anaerovoracaceae bacterium]|jgi:periplasmic divalent cation tolerance protein